MGLFRDERTSQKRLHANSISEISIDESCGVEIGCGSCSSKRYPISFLQCFATTKGALVFLSLAAIIQGFIVNGNINAVISTIEKRFELSSTESGLIASCFDIAACITIPFITYIGSRRHKPLWLGWGIVLMGLGSILFALPHFWAPTYTFTESTNTCTNAASESCIISTLKNYRFVFYLAMLIVGVGANPLYSLGITYLDENVKQRFSALYNGLFMGCSVFGPGIGFLIGAAFLRIYTNPHENVSITESSESWVGAWWVGSLFAGALALLAAIPVLMYPKKIPGWEKHQRSRVTEAHANTDHDENFGKRFRDFPKCFLILLKNPTFVCLGVAGGIDSLIINGLATFGPKYMETIFGFEPSTAGTYFGLLAILGAASGQIAGGAVLSKFNLSLKRMLQISYLSPVLCIFLSGAFMISCGDIKFAGVNTAYHDLDTRLSTNLSSICNANCGCSKDVYSPVCGSDNIMYFSPCFAGCENQTGTIFSNCSCIAAAPSGLADNSSALANGTATLGVCTGTGCGDGSLFILYCILVFFLMFFTFFNESSVLQASLRVVSFHQRTFGIGIQWMAIRLLGTIPGPLVVGAIFDSACASWSEKCGTRGACLAYHSSKLSLYVFLFTSIIKAVDAAVYFLGAFLYKPKEDATYDRHSSSASHTTTENDESPTKRKVSSVVSEQPTINGTHTTTLPGEISSAKSCEKDVFENFGFEEDRDAS